jgi:hypothetical protein
VSELPLPLSPADCDITDFPFMPMEIHRLFNSEFHARSDDAAWRAGITLWLKSFHQVPAGSVPDDDVSLARLAEMGRDVKAWRKIRDQAMYGWIKCSDGRFYHPVVAEKAAEAWTGKKAQRARTAKARLHNLLGKLAKSSDTLDCAGIETSVQNVLQEMSQYLSQEEMKAVTSSVTESVTEAKRKREGKGKGQGINSVPDGTGAGAPKSAEQMTKDELWTVGKSLLVQAGMAGAQCGSFVGKLCKDYGDEIVLAVVRETVVQRPADPASFMKALCQQRKGEKPNRQEAQELRNRSVADELAREAT